MSPRCAKSAARRGGGDEWREQRASAAEEVIFAFEDLQT